MLVLRSYERATISFLFCLRNDATSPVNEFVSARDFHTYSDTFGLNKNWDVMPAGAEIKKLAFGDEARD